MAHELPDGFIDKYFSEIKHLASQHERMLAGFAQEGGLFVGEEAHFLRASGAETIRASRMQELMGQGANIDWVKVRCEPEFIPWTLWDPDKKKYNLDAAALFAYETIGAINRARDRQHIDALKAAATSGVVTTKGTENIVTIGDYDTVMDLEMICDAIVRLGTNHLFSGQKIGIIAPFKLRVHNALDPYFAKQGELKGNRPWDDLMWGTYERLPGNGTDGAGWLDAGATGVDIFVHAKSAVKTVMNDDVTDINERLGARLADMIGAWFQSASTVTEAKGVIRIKSKLDFALLRKAIPTFETNPDMEPA